MSDLFENVTVEEVEEPSRLDLEPYKQFLRIKCGAEQGKPGKQQATIPDVPTGDLYTMKVGNKTITRGRNEAKQERMFKYAAEEMDLGVHVVHTHLSGGVTRMRIWTSERRVQSEESKVKRAATLKRNQEAKKRAAEAAAKAAEAQTQPQTQPQPQQAPANPRR